jgi:putative ABC transport system substrate-binding protein
LWEAFRHGLRDQGYVEGTNIVLEYRFAAGQNERLPALAAELVQLQVDLIVTNSGAGAHAAKDATKTIPIVMATSGDLVVANLARPGGNITGLTLMAPDLGGKRLEFLKEALPHVSRVAVLQNAGDPRRQDALREIEAAARVLGLHLHALAVRHPDELDSVFAAMTREGAEALIIPGDAVLWNHRTHVVALAAQHHLPAVFDAREYADAGGLMTYGPSVADSYRRAAVYVDKILKGTKPADLPVERPVKFELVINLKTAKALGVTLPPALLFQADEVIQ